MIAVPPSALTTLTVISSPAVGFEENMFAPVGVQFVAGPLQVRVAPAAKLELAQVTGPVPRALVESAKVSEKAPVIGLDPMLSIVTV